VQIDFECEFATVIARPAHYVTVDRAADYIFGYTAHHDVSDRGGPADHDPRRRGRHRGVRLRGS
jgi:2-keto-4-pentenoate hydratase/2-oxohepta-3-ene-1,7-dioic acid hydratase in catechol pathway